MRMNLLLLVFAALCVDAGFSRRWSSSRYRDSSTRMCRSGDGSSYRGLVSTSTDGHHCLNWRLFENPVNAVLKGLGNHNYCRNPDHSLMPWCYVRRGRKAVRQFCNIPSCFGSTSETSPAPDSETTCGQRSDERRTNKVVGGSFAPVESHPWVAAIYKSRRFLCGGTLIAPCWVVTAAHCFTDGDSTKIKLSVYLGKTAINETDADREQKFYVDKLIIHQRYNESSFNNDIALLKIRSRNGGCAVKSASARTACLPPLHTQLPAGFRCSIAGFGRERFMAWHYSQYLKQADVNLIPRQDCDSYYGDQVSRNMICAASPDWSTDACKGDSGGPLVCEVSGRMFLFGVVSWGDECAKKNKPGVYTQVSNYNRWIAAKTGLTEYTQGKMYPLK